MSTTKSGAGVQGAPAPKAVKPEISETVIPAKAQKPAKNLEEIKQRVDQYGQLLEKHSTFQESKKKLDSFVIGSDENNTKLTLKAGYGSEFSTSNPVVLKEVIAIIRRELNAQCAKVEDEVYSFII